MDAGISGKDDTLPKRLLKDAAQTDPAKDKVNELEKMLPEYYSLRSWDEDGIPEASTLERLNII